MRIAIIGPNSPIPPTGWGAVEALIWDYKCYLEKFFGCKVLIIHQDGDAEIIQKVNDFQPDVVHIQYDNFWYLWNKFTCKKVIVTNHFAYIESPQLRNHEITRGIANSGALIHCLSEGVQRVYTQEYQVPPERTFVLPNGANERLFTFNETPSLPHKTIYLAKIDYRKRQYVYQHIPTIDFIGNYHDARFNLSHPNYKGEWSREQLYQHLTEYGNLALLSDGEVHPLVCCEALICGLGLVVSEFAAANLDRSLPFIDVIPTERLEDIAYIAEVLERNRQVSLTMRSHIREYGIQVFSWYRVLEHYVKILSHIQLEKN